MTSKERTLTALEHKETDRPLCEYHATPEVDKKLMEYFKTDSMDVVLEHLGTDLRYVSAPYIGPELRTWPDGRFENEWGQIRKYIRNEAGEYKEAVEFPYAEFQTVEDVENFRWPKVEWFDYSNIEADCDKYKDYAVVFGVQNNMDLINGTALGQR